MCNVNSNHDNKSNVGTWGTKETGHRNKLLPVSDLTRLTKTATRTAPTFKHGCLSWNSAVYMWPLVFLATWQIFIQIVNRLYRKRAKSDPYIITKVVNQFNSVRLDITLKAAKRVVNSNPWQSSEREHKYVAAYQRVPNWLKKSLGYWTCSSRCLLIADPHPHHKR